MWRSQSLEDEAILASFKSLVPDMIEATCNMHAVAGEELAVQAYSTTIEVQNSLANVKH